MLCDKDAQFLFLPKKQRMHLLSIRFAFACILERCVSWNIRILLRKAVVTLYMLKCGSGQERKIARHCLHDDMKVMGDGGLAE